jgi:hypothetical protein
MFMSLKTFEWNSFEFKYKYTEYKKSQVLIQSSFDDRSKRSDSSDVVAFK